MSGEDRRPTPVREVYSHIASGLFGVVVSVVFLTATEVGEFWWWWGLVTLPIAVGWVAYWLIDLLRHRKDRAKIRAEEGPDRWDPWWG